MVVDGSDASGSIDFDEFKAVLSANTAASGIRRLDVTAELMLAFDFDCDWMKLYVGKRGGRHVVGCGYHRIAVLKG